jgi:hypothetical protein
MANKVTKFVDPAGTYNTLYTSNTIETRLNEASNAEKAIFQVDLSATGTAELLMRIDDTASWVVYGSYTADTLVEVPLAKYMRVLVVANTGTINAFLQEIE